MRLIINKPDTFGALASTLCMMHCIATPFLFIAQTCSVSCCETTPIWWKGLDYVFLIISFFAIYRATRTTSNKSMKLALWVAWFVLLLVISNEMFEFVYLPESFSYVPALTLVALHLYNLKYCQCKTENCCTNHG